MISILSTDTTHHRYFINELRDAGVSVGAVYIETTSIEPPFEIGPLFEDAQEAHELVRWQGRMSLEGVDVHEIENINDIGCNGTTEQAGPKLGLVFGTRRLQPHQIQSFPDGLINVHRGIIEAYRGLDSEFWAIYHRDYGNLGVTLHQVDENLDTGPVLAQERLSLRRGMKIHELRAELTEIASRAMVCLLTSAKTDRLAAVAQTERGRYYSFMPLALKKIVAKRFDNHCAGLDRD